MSEHGSNGGSDGGRRAGDCHGHVLDPCPHDLCPVRGDVLRLDSERIGTLRDLMSERAERRAHSERIDEHLSHVLDQLVRVSSAVQEIGVELKGLRRDLGLA